MARIRMCLVAMLLPAVVEAQPASGLYVGGAAGVNFSDPLLSSQADTKVDTRAGPLGLAAVGWGFGSGLRVEVEGSYRSNDISGIRTLRVDGNFHPLTGVAGRVGTTAAMANLAYDLPLRPFGLPFRPYVGAGVGYAWFDLGSTTGTGFGRFLLPQDDTYTGPDTVTFGSGGAFAYQAIAEVALPLRLAPYLEATLEYRFFGAASGDVAIDRVANNGNSVNGVIPSSHVRNGFALADNAILLGLRYSFGAH